jgi:hypothetical protein
MDQKIAQLRLRHDALRIEGLRVALAFVRGGAVADRAFVAGAMKLELGECDVDVVFAPSEGCGDFARDLRLQLVHLLVGRDAGHHAIEVFAFDPLRHQLGGEPLYGRRCCHAASLSNRRLDAACGSVCSHQQRSRVMGCGGLNHAPIEGCERERGDAGHVFYAVLLERLLQ